MAADAAIVTLALSRSGAETGTHNRTNATNDQLNRTNANGRTNKRNGRNCKLIASRKGGGEIRGGAVNPLRSPPNNSSPPRCSLRILLYDTFLALAIVSGDTSPMSAPSSQILKSFATIKRLSRSSVTSIFPITSFPSISLSMKRYNPFE